MSLHHAHAHLSCALAHVHLPDAHVAAHVTACLASRVALCVAQPDSHAEPVHHARGASDGEPQSDSYDHHYADTGRPADRWRR